MAALNRDIWDCVCVTCLHQEMKRVRTEQVQYAVTQYLKRRQYIDTDGSLKGAKLSQTAEEMAASLTGDCTLNQHGPLTLNDSDSDAHLHISLSFCCEQFRRSPAVRMWCLQPRVSLTRSSTRPSSSDCAPSCRVRDQLLTNALLIETEHLGHAHNPTLSIDFVLREAASLSHDKVYSKQAKKTELRFYKLSTQKTCV